MKKILITGSGGFIGGFIVEEALKRGYETWAGVRKSTNREYLTDERIRFVDLNFGDRDRLCRQLSDLRNQIGRWDYIVHNLGVTKCKNPADFERINCGFVRNFVTALTETDMTPERFVLMSSLGAWGAGDETTFRPISPTDDPRPETRYGVSKLHAEEAVRSVPDFPYIILRPTGVYGPREKDYYLMMKSIRYGIDFQAGYKRQVLTFIYVKDLVKVIFMAIEKKVVRRAYFVSDGRCYTAADFRRLVAGELGKKYVLPLHVPLWVLKGISAVAESGAAFLGKASTLNRDKYRIMKQRNWICDVSPLQQELDFSPDYDLEKGVKESVTWYRQNGWL